MPERVGKYKVIGILGSGAFGTVYLASDPDLEREVALKQLAPSLAREPGFMEGFREEAAIMARLDHPNCIHVYDYFEDKTGAFLVSEYVAGASLRKLLDENGRLGPEQALGVTRGALTGLAFAHELGLVHRDVKPENLLADMEGTSKLADFGQAFFAGEVKGGERQSTGSPAYMSPEQVRGDQGDVRSDVYAAGVVLYEFLAGRPPFIGLSRVAVMKMHLERDPPELNRVNPRVPLDVSRVVGTALAKEPSDRYSSAGEFLAVLEEVARDSYGAAWLERASIAAMVATAAATAGAALAGSAAATTAVGNTAVGEAVVPPAPAPEPEPAPEPPPPPPPAPEPAPEVEAAPSPAVAAALAAADPALTPRKARRPPGVGAGIAAAVAGLLVGAGLGVISPLRSDHTAAVVTSTSPSPSATSAAPVVTEISAHFDDATSTTYYQLQGADPGASFKWGWLRKPPCGTLQADPSGLSAAYAHNGCNPVAEAAGVIGVCVTNTAGSAEYQRNARYGDGALAANDAAAAGVSGDQFSQQAGTADCATSFTGTAAAAVAPVSVPGAAASASASTVATPSASPQQGSSSSTFTAGDLVPAGASALGGLLLLAAGMLMLRRRVALP